MGGVGGRGGGMGRGHLGLHSVVGGVEGGDILERKGIDLILVVLVLVVVVVIIVLVGTGGGVVVGGRGVVVGLGCFFLEGMVAVYVRYDSCMIKEPVFLNAS